MVRDLRGVIEREDPEMGVMVTLARSGGKCVFVGFAFASNNRIRRSTVAWRREWPLDH